MAAEGEVAGPVSPIDPRSSDPAMPAWEHTQRHGLTFEAALDDVRASIARREEAVHRIRKIRDDIRTKLAGQEGGHDGNRMVCQADELPESPH